MINLLFYMIQKHWINVVSFFVLATIVTRVFPCQVSELSVWESISEAETMEKMLCKS